MNVQLTASYKKPNNQVSCFYKSLKLHLTQFAFKSILRNAAIPNYLRPLPFQKVRI